MQNPFRRHVGLLLRAMHTSKYYYADNVPHFYLRAQLPHVNVLMSCSLVSTDTGVAMGQLDTISRAYNT